MERITIKVKVIMLDLDVCSRVNVIDCHRYICLIIPMKLHIMKIQEEKAMVLLQMIFSQDVYLELYPISFVDTGKGIRG